MMGDPLGPGGSGYFHFEPCEYNLVASNIIMPPPKMAKTQLVFGLRRPSENEFMISVVSIPFPN
jgi:hypothetical protein